MSEAFATEPILVLVRDLIFATKIIATAKDTGASVKTIRDPQKLAGETGRKLIVDLNLPGAIEAAGAWCKEVGRPAIGFVSHTDTATISAARDAGIHLVMARSQFVRVLPELLKA